MTPLQWVALVQRGCVLIRALKGEQASATDDHVRELERSQKIDNALRAAESWAKEHKGP